VWRSVNPQKKRLEGLYKVFAGSVSSLNEVPVGNEEIKMVFYGDPKEIKKYIDDQLNPDLHDDTNRTSGTILYLTRIMIRSIRALSDFDRALLKAELLSRVPIGSVKDQIQ